jgi:hypothetical protein
MPQAFYNGSTWPALRSRCAHPLRVILSAWRREILAAVNPRDRLRSVGRRVTDPAEALAQQVTERVIDLLVNALDINELAARIDLNALLGRVDFDAVLKKVDLDAVLDRVDVNALLARLDLKPLLDRVDVNDLVQRVDMDALVERTDLGAVIARSSGGMGSEALDAVRSQAVGLDQFVDRWVQRLLRRKHPTPPAPAALLSAYPAAIPARAEP